MILSILKFLFPKTMDEYSMDEFGKGWQMGWEWNSGEDWPDEGDCSDLFAKVHEAIDNAATEGKQS